MDLCKDLFKKANILVIGDVMLDNYWEGPAHRISPEAPVPVVKIEKETLVLGGAANVAHNLTSLENSAYLIGFCGEDAAAESLKNSLKQAKIQDKLIQTSTPTIVKLRVLSQHQQLIRLDFEKNYKNSEQDLSALIQEAMRNCLIKHPEINLIIFSDYGKGTLDNIQELIKIAEQKNIKIIIDPKGTDFKKYRGAYLLTPNYSEFITIVGPCPDEAIVIQKAKDLLKETGIQNLLLTRGADGMTLVQHNGEITYQPALAKEVFDVTGAGDTVVAVASLSIAAGYDLKNAMHFANTAAGIVVGKVGTATVTPSEFRAALQAEHSESLASLKTGVVSREMLAEAVSQAKAKGDKIIFTNGCFDLLHMGHVEYLKQARSLGDRLIVAMNTDDSVRKLKGPTRPILPEVERAALLAALSCVDWVVSFDEETPEALLKLLKPDILVKGGDYDESGIVGHEIVKSYGGKVLPLKLIPGRSSSQIIEKIIKTH